MTSDTYASGFRVQKLRIEARLSLAGDETVSGCFFVAGSSAHLPGAERVGDLLNADEGFFPFELHDGGRPRTALFNRQQVVLVALSEPESRRDPGYDVAKRRLVAIRLPGRGPLIGTVLVYCPEGHDRLSDWTRQPERFRYVETDEATLLVNVAHVIEISEVNAL